MSDQQTNEKDVVAQTIEERGKIYGDPAQSHTNIGLTWTALIQQHYGIVLDHPIPNYVVAQMMVQFKVQRSARVFHGDNFVDAEAYLRFAREFQSCDYEIKTGMNVVDRNGKVFIVSKCSDQQVFFSEPDNGSKRPLECGSYDISLFKRNFKPSNH